MDLLDTLKAIGLVEIESESTEDMVVMTFAEWLEPETELNFDGDHNVEETI